MASHPNMDPFDPLTHISSAQMVIRQPKATSPMTSPRDSQFPTFQSSRILPNSPTPLAVVPPKVPLLGPLASCSATARGRWLRLSHFQDKTLRTPPAMGLP